MAEGLSCLCGVMLPATTLTDIYVAPMEVALSSIVVCNHGGSATTFRLSHAKAGVADAPGQYFVYDASIQANQMVPFTIGICLGPGDVLRAYAGNANLSVVAWGELSSTVSGGASTFLELLDTPDVYTGQAGKLVLVNPAETAVEFGDAPASGLDTEAVQDTVAAMFPLSATLDFAYNDPLGVFDANVRSGSITETHLLLADVTADNATTGMHGFLPKLSGVATEYMNGVGGWSTPASGGTPGGSNGQVQYNASGAFAGDTALIWDPTNNRLGINVPTPVYTLDMTGGAKSTQTRSSGGATGFPAAVTPGSAFVDTVTATGPDVWTAGMYLAHTFNNAGFTSNGYTTVLECDGLFQGGGEGALYGLSVDLDVGGAGTEMADMAGIIVWAGTQAAGTIIQNWSGIAVHGPPANFVSSQRAYALWSGMAAGTNNWGLYFGTPVKHYLSGSLGIGSGKETPAETIDAAGAIRLGTTSNSNNGSIRYNGTDIEGCTAGTWKSLTAQGSGGSGSPGGSNGQIQYNASGAFAGDTALVWNPTDNRLGINVPTPAFSLDIDGRTQIYTTRSGGVSFPPEQEGVLKIHETFTATGPNYSTATLALSQLFNNASQNGIGYTTIIDATAMLGSGGRSSLYGFQLKLDVFDATTATDVIGIRMLGTDMLATTTIERYTGVHMEDWPSDMLAANSAYAFRSLYHAGTNKYCLYMDGTAQNYLRGNLGVGTGKTAPAEVIDAAGAIRLGTTANTNNGTIRYTGADIEGCTGGTWKSLTATASKVVRIGHTWALVGDVTPYTNLPAFFVPEGTAQATAIHSLRCKIASGTSVVAQVRRNLGNLGSAITVTTTATTTSMPFALTDADEIDLVLSSPTGTPTNLTVTMILEHTI